MFVGVLFMRVFSPRSVGLRGEEKLGHGRHDVIVLYGWFGDETFMNPTCNAVSLDESTHILPAYRRFGASATLTEPIRSGT